MQLCIASNSEISKEKGNYLSLLHFWDIYASVNTFSSFAIIIFAEVMSELSHSAENSSGALSLKSTYFFSDNNIAYVAFTL